MNLVRPHIASLFGLHLSPSLASFLTVAFIVFLFRRDIRERPDVSGALWLALLWFVLICSRHFSGWLNICGLPVSSAASVEEGSPLDAYFYLTLVFFFSSRRRHTRFDCDWSSDVCSSDLDRCYRFTRYGKG